VITQKLHFESTDHIDHIVLQKETSVSSLKCDKLQYLPSNITNIRMRASDIAFITTFCKGVAEKSGIAIFSFIRTYFHVKKAKKSQKARHIFKVSHLEMRPKKDQLKFFRSTNLKRGQSGNLAQEPQARRDYAT